MKIYPAEKWLFPTRLLRVAVAAFPLLAIATSSFAAENVTISTAATSNGTLSGGVFTPTGDDANLNVADLKAALAVSDVTVNTGTTGSQDGNITLANKLAWLTNTLTLNAFRSVIINARVNANGTSGLALKTPRGGTLTFNGTGKIVFANTSQAFKIGTTNYTLVADLPTLATDISGNQHGDFALINNYDASMHTYGNAPIAVEFIGDFEGLGNTISNLTITSSATGQSNALFSWLGAGGSIENLSLTNVSVHNTSSAADVAALVVRNDGDLNNVSAAGQVSQTSGAPIGGLVEFNDGSMENCSAAVSVSAVATGNTAGGLVGQNSGTITSCSATGTVSETSTNIDQVAGGLAGVNEGLIEHSFAKGNVSAGKEALVGGLVGFNLLNGSIDQSYATGDAMGGDESNVGGLVGEMTKGGGTPTIINSYANGNVTGLSNAVVGGLIGENSLSAISFCYSTGTPTALGTNPIIGGFVGADLGTNTDNYWSKTSSGITNPSQGAGDPPNDPGITGLTNTQFRAGLPTGFDSATWGEAAGVNFGLPYLLALPPS